MPYPATAVHFPIASLLWRNTICGRTCSSLPARSQSCKPSFRVVIRRFPQARTGAPGAGSATMRRHANSAWALALQSSTIARLSECRLVSFLRVTTLGTRRSATWLSGRRANRPLPHHRAATKPASGDRGVHPFDAKCGGQRHLALGHRQRGPCALVERWRGLPAAATQGLEIRNVRLRIAWDDGCLIPRASQLLPGIRLHDGLNEQRD